MLACDAKNRGVFKIERCEMPAIRTLAAVWPAMRAPGCQIASDVGRAMRTTKFLTEKSLFQNGQDMGIP